MRTRYLSLAAVALSVVVAGVRAHTSAPEVGGGSAALAGQVTSAEEGPMEGVLVSAKKTDSTIMTTVVTDAQGRYAFPRGRLDTGHYTLKIRAVGYVLDGAASADVVEEKTATADLKLKTTRDIASQLTNAEWLASLPGPDEQRAATRLCAHCHLLQLATRSRYDADTWLPVIQRMATYPPLAFPLMPQKRPADRVGEAGGEDVMEREARGKRQAEYLSQINLSGGADYSYPLKPFPRPKGQATRVIYTTFDLAPKTRQPHDVIVDRSGTVWYASFGEQVLGKLDQKTGKVTEYKVPVLKPDAPTGILALREDPQGNLWLALQFQGGVAKFDPKTEKFQTWSLPAELNGPHVQITEVSPEHSDVDGKVWIVDAGTYTVLRLDPATGKFDVFEPFKLPRPNIYDVIPDAQNNAYFTVMGREHIGRVDAKTGKIELFETPTKQSAPRRGTIDAQGRVWFGENRSNKLGMFDPKTRTFQEWTSPTPWALPYDAMADRNGEVWTGGEYSDRVLRVDPKSGRMTEYLLPAFTNIRRVFVDNRSNPVTFWVGSNHAASIVKLEPID